MDSKLPRALGAFAVFFTLTLPLFAGMIAAATYTPLVNMVTRAGFNPTNGLADIFFNHFKVALAFPLLVGIAGALAAFLVWRKRDAEPALVLGRLLVIQTLASFATLLWFAAYIVAAVKG